MLSPVLILVINTVITAELSPVLYTVYRQMQMHMQMQN